MWRSTASTTTIASSTTSPIARISANIVRMLIVKPSAPNAANVPMSDTGIASMGISDARAVPRKTNTTRSTSRNACTSVRSTSFSAATTKFDVSKPTSDVRPGGKFLAKPFMTERAAVEAASALEPGLCSRTMIAAGWDFQ